MIAVLTPNPALDVTYRTPAIALGAVNRVQVVRRQAGGKGVNVAQVLRQLGVSPLSVLPLGGPTGERVRSEMLELGHRVLVVDLAEETRTTVVVDSGAAEATGLYERGPMVSADEWSALTEHVLGATKAGDLLVVSGSLPPGVTPETLAALVRAASAAGRATLVDSSGDALEHAARAGADYVKPNQHELREVTGESDWRSGAATLRAWGAGTVVVSLGKDGLARVDDSGITVVTGIPTLQGNPTGAGDATVAALAFGIDRDGVLSDETLQRAAACGAAAVLSPTAGAIDLAQVATFVAHTQLKENEVATSIDADGPAIEG
ncbi:1-phosphofructokinase family hexose kinase [Humidisolicoccus flavus]|uniref:1-phosphofructokinase family hexose kinase n=1 Tax=Humidisolicoccus flavus TaxID=3111414 RepID=UPI0032569C72